MSRLRWSVWMAMAAVVAGITMASPSVAQVDEAPESAEAVAETETANGQMKWQEIVRSGGWPMYVLAAMSILTVAFVIYFFVVLRGNQIAPRALHRDLVEKIKAGNLDDARRACEYRPCPLAAVAITALDYVRNIPEGDAVLLKDVVEGEGQRQAESLQGQAQYLLDIAVVAPMVGLLGTVLGMLKAFSSIALEIASAKPVVLAAGVSQALITTAFGLMIGIPAMAFYAFFRRRAASMLSQLESAATDVLAALLSKRS